MRSFGAFSAFGLLVFLAACGSKPPPAPVVAVPPAEDPALKACNERRASQEKVIVDLTAENDELKASVAAMEAERDKPPPEPDFTLADATVGLPATGQLNATIKTSMGDLKCKLFDDKAPITVTNFVGLARGARKWKTPGGEWVKKPAYDGTKFHRIIKGFMIQGGDAKGDGTGEPGFTFKDEVWSGAKHDKPGLLCMANRGPNTNGAQFFITDAAAAHLDRSYTIFGECTPVSVVHAIAGVKTDGSDHPLKEVSIKSVEITRTPAKAPQAAPKKP